jgi:hypothetical protein
VTTAAKPLDRVHPPPPHTPAEAVGACSEASTMLCTTNEAGVPRVWPLQMPGQPLWNRL